MFNNLLKLNLLVIIQQNCVCIYKKSLYYYQGFECHSIGLPVSQLSASGNNCRVSCWSVYFTDVMKKQVLKNPSKHRYYRLNSRVFTKGCKKHEEFVLIATPNIESKRDYYTATKSQDNFLEFYLPTAA